MAKDTASPKSDRAIEVVGDFLRDTQGAFYVQTDVECPKCKTTCREYYGADIFPRQSIVHSVRFLVCGHCFLTRTRKPKRWSKERKFKKKWAPLYMAKVLIEKRQMVENFRKKIQDKSGNSIKDGQNDMEALQF